MTARARRRAGMLALVVVALAVTPRRAVSHELAETSATLVVREGGHVELRLQIPWADVLQRAWMPKVGVQEALVRITAQPAADFARELRKVQRTVEDGVRLTPDASGAVPFVRWQWPTPEDVRSALKMELMSRLAVGTAFDHLSRLPALAELALNHDMATVRLATPAVLGATLLTAYRPAEQWIGPGALSAPVGVKRPVP